MTSTSRMLNEIHVFFLDARGNIDKLKIVLVVSVGFSVVSLGIFSATFIQSQLAKSDSNSKIPRKMLTIDERVQALAQLSATSESPNNSNSTDTSTSTPKKKGLTEEEKMQILKQLSAQN